MIKRTLYFGNPAYLNTANEQMVVNLSAKERSAESVGERSAGSGERGALEKGAGVIDTKIIPIEDIGVLILDNAQITITQALLAKLLYNNVAVITCDATHHPTGMLLNLDGNTLQSKIFAAQLAATEPLKKQLWQQTVVAKINNQAAVLGMQGHSLPKSGSLFREPDKIMLSYGRDVKSGDIENMEARAAAYYWKNVFPEFLAFTRDRYGFPPNNLLNYGYAILRAVVARSLVGTGLLPTVGIHHRNQYNAYCLADDVMEPYRPYVDKVVCEIVGMNGQYLELTPNMKKQLLGIPAMDVMIDEQTSPLMNAVARTTASLARCYEGKVRKILYPVI